MGKLEAYNELEQKWSEWLGDITPHCVACSSGTAALHLGLEAVRLPLGSRVVVPEFTMVACARAVSMADHIPFFVDCGDDMNLDSDLLGTIPPETKAVMAVHIYGRQCAMGQVHDRSNCVMIEDLAEAHGIKPHPRTDVACWSFYKNKIIAGEEGGMVAFKEKEHADWARSLRSLGFTHEHNFLHIPRGHNYRMSNAHAKLVLESLQFYNANNYRRRVVEEYYDRHIPDEWKMPPRDAVWVYDVKLPQKVDTEGVVRELKFAGIDARLGFRCMSEQPEFQMVRNPQFKQTKAYEMSRRVIYLPVRPEMSQVDVNVAATTLKKAVDRYL